MKSIILSCWYERFPSLNILSINIFCLTVRQTKNRLKLSKYLIKNTFAEMIIIYHRFILVKCRNVIRRGMIPISCADTMLATVWTSKRCLGTFRIKRNNDFFVRNIDRKLKPNLSSLLLRCRKVHEISPSE